MVRRTGRRRGTRNSQPQITAGHVLPRRAAVRFAARATDLPGLRSFATGIEHDLAAVTAGLTLEWNSGAVEGHVNRTTMLKRQMYGRASAGLLRKRVLTSS